jgi:hypothetical protein
VFERAKRNAYASNHKARQNIRIAADLDADDLRATI